MKVLLPAVLWLWLNTAYVHAWQLIEAPLPRYLSPITTDRLSVPGDTTATQSVTDIDQPETELSGYDQSRTRGEAERRSNHGPLIGGSHVAGEGVGFDQSFSTLDAFIPLLTDSNNVLFADLRVLWEDFEPFGANLGIGHRIYSDSLDRTFGAYLYYDYRDTRDFIFHQLSPGFESLGENWDFRTNVYIPSAFGDQMAPANRFEGHFLLIDRFAVPMDGLDMELGIPLPILPHFQPKIHGGWYHFHGEGLPDVTGWRARLESHVSDALQLDLSVQDDPTFGTTVNFGVSTRFPAAGIRSWRDLWGRLVGPARYHCVRHRLDDRVERLRNIVVTEQAGTIARHPLIDPLTEEPHPKAGEPIFFLHVAPGGNSNGSFQDPYLTLTAALADGRYQAGGVDVVYVRHDPSAPIVHTGNITNLVANTRLLSNIPVQQVNTQLGFQKLPFSGVDPLLQSLPQIAGNVTLVDNTMLSGFEVQQGLSGAGISGINVINNKINNSSGDAIRLTGITDRLADPVDADDLGQFASVRIESNKISATGGRGISLEVTESSDNILTGFNVIESSGGSGIHIGGSDYGTALFGQDNTRINVGLSQITTTGAGGVEFDGSDFLSNSRVIISDSKVNSTGGPGVRIAGDNFAGRFDIQRSTGQNAFNTDVGVVSSSDNIGVELVASSFSGVFQIAGASRIAGTSGVVVNGADFSGVFNVSTLRRFGLEFSTQNIVATSGSGIEIRAANPALLNFLDVDIEDTHFTTTGGTALLVDFTGERNRNLVLSKNISTDAPAPGLFNYDLRTTGGGTLTLFSIDAMGNPIPFTQTNVGSVGLNGVLIAP